MKTFQFSKLKQPPVTEENFWVFFNKKTRGFQSEWKKKSFFSTSFSSGPTSHESCQASAQLELSLQVPVPQGATFHPDPSAERCWGLVRGHPCRVSVAGKNSTSDLICHALLIDIAAKRFAAVTVCVAAVMVTAGRQVWLLPCITFICWSVCNLAGASCVLSAMRDFCKYPLNFCSFHIWRIIYLVFYNLPSCIFSPRLDCTFVQSSLLCRLLGILLSTSWKM